MGARRYEETPFFVVLRKFTTQKARMYVVATTKVKCFLPGESEKRGAFVGLWRRTEQFDHRQLNFSMQPAV